MRRAEVLKEKLPKWTEKAGDPAEEVLLEAHDLDGCKAANLYTVMSQIS